MSFEGSPTLLDAMQSAQQWYDEGRSRAKSGYHAELAGVPSEDTGLKAGEPAKWYTAGYTDALWGKPRREITEGDIAEGAPPMPVTASPLPSPVATPLDQVPEDTTADSEPLPPPEVPELQEYAAAAPPAPRSSAAGIALGVVGVAAGLGILLYALSRRR